VLAEETRVGGESFDVRVVGEPANLEDVGAVEVDDGHGRQYRSLMMRWQALR